MTDDARSTAIETPDAPAMPPLRRRLWYLAAMVVILAIVAVYVISPRPRPLSPMEARLLGTWELVDSDGVVTNRLTFFPDRTCFQITYPGATPQGWHHLWRIEVDRLFAVRPRRGWEDYLNGILDLTIFSPRTFEASIDFVSDDELLFGGTSGEKYIRRDDD